MDTQTKDTGLLERLDTLPDEMLRDLIERAKALLVSRRTERQAHALAQIRQLAVDHGLHVKAKTGARKRGRPRKADIVD